MKHRNIVKTKEVPWQTKYFPGDETPYGEYQALFEEHGTKQFEVRTTRIGPGGTHTKYHSHSKTEEWFYILSGSCHVIIEGTWTLIKAGDSIHTPPGVLHFFRNFGTEDCEMIIVGSNVEGDEVTRLDEPAPPQF